MYKQPSILIIATLLLIAACDVVEQPPVAPQADGFLSAPASDQKVYATPQTGEYHLANPRCYTEDRIVMLKSEAIAAGYTACGYCLPIPYVSPEPHVWLLPHDTEFYHINFCRDLTDDKILTLKAVALENGYTPCPECAAPKPVGKSWKIVYVTKTGEQTTFVYHTNRSCKHLDHLSASEKNAITEKLGEEIAEGFDECKDCGEERHLEDDG